MRCHLSVELLGKFLWVQIRIEHNQTDRQTDIYTHKKTDKQTNKQEDRQTLLGTMNIKRKKIKIKYYYLNNDAASKSSLNSF